MSTAVTKPIFIDNDLQTIINEMIADYQTRTGKTLQPAQVERLLLDSMAYRESLTRSQIQGACEQNFVDFAIAPILDYLGNYVGVKRLSAAFAVTTLRFTLTSLHVAGTIIQGKRVAADDGMIFTTSQNVDFLPSDTYIDVPAICSTEGALGNGYLTGAIYKLLDPSGFIASVSNTTMSAGGDDEEGDDALRARIKLAPESYSCAGSRGSYKFFALTASQTIVDVLVDSSAPGTVQIYPLVEGGISTPVEILNAVMAICSDEKVRPLCDTVTVISPTAVTYTLNIGVRVAPGAVVQDVLAAVLSAVQEYTDSQIIGVCIDTLDCIDATLGYWTTIIPTVSQFAKCTSILTYELT
jgi:phage-related baseplate assembly protein